MTDDVIVNYQGDRTSRWAVEWAAVEAAARGVHLRVVVATDRAPLASCPPARLVGRWAELCRRGKTLAVTGERLARAAVPGLGVRSEVHVGSPVGVLVAASHDADLVVLGAGRGHLREMRRQARFVDAVAAHAHCPVAVVGRAAAEHPGPGRPVVVGVDGSVQATAALDVAAAVAAHRDAPLRVVCVQGAGRRVTAAPGRVTELALARARHAHPGLRGIGHVAGGEPRTVLPRLAHRSGLLVLGRQGAGADRSLLIGSVSRAALGTLPCPVVIVGQLRRLPTSAPPPAVPRPAAAAASS